MSDTLVIMVYLEVLGLWFAIWFVMLGPMFDILVEIKKKLGVEE